MAWSWTWRAAGPTAAGWAPIRTRTSSARWPSSAESGQGVAGLAQQAGQRDQGQADQAGRVARFDRLEQGDAQAFALEAAGAVEGLLGIDVALDLVPGQGAEVDAGQVGGGEATAGALQADAGVEMHHAPAHRGQLGDRRLAVAWLAQDAAIQFGGLVPADHPVLRAWGGDRTGLGGRQPPYQRGHVLARQRGCVHLRARALEGQAQALQQCAAVPGARGEDEHGRIVGEWRASLALRRASR